MGGLTTEFVPPDVGMPIEHVVDRYGYVWRLVRDGGMATRAHYAGLVSIGIAALERESGPLTNLGDQAAALARVEALADEWDEARRPGMVGISKAIRAALRPDPNPEAVSSDA